MAYYQGTSAMEWLDRTPIAVIRACQAQMPRLRARDAIRESTRIAVGTGSVTKESSKSIRKEWHRTAEFAQAAPERKSAAQLGGAGFGVRTVPVKKAADGVR